MHAVVAIKQVPDTTNVRINPETGTLIREGVPAIINPYDVHAVELAVRLKEQYGGKVTVVTMGPPKASEALSECVEQGADRCILITDRKFAAADTLATSYVVWKAIDVIMQEEPVDIFIFGMQAIDGDTAQVGPGVATRLGVPLISYATHIESVDVAAKTAIIHRKAERGSEVLQTSLPALLTVVKEITPVKRAPLSYMLKAIAYQPEVWTSETPHPFDPSLIGIKGSPTIVGKAFTPPPKEPGDVVQIAERGLSETVAYALDQIKIADVLDWLSPDGAGGAQ
jgi:electron transfer flavoprotein beta subunit